MGRDGARHGVVAVIGACMSFRLWIKLQSTARSTGVAPTVSAAARITRSMRVVPRYLLASRCRGSVARPASLDPNDPSVVNNQQKGQTHHYVGISGSLGVPRGGNRNTDYGGVVRGNGLLGISRHAKIRDAVDGTSSTIMVAEQSAEVNIDGTFRNVSSNYYGGWSGQAGRQATDKAGRPHWGAGTTCLRYPINHGAGKQVVARSSIPGADRAWDFNTIVNSFHTGGIQVGLGDGSIRFISENIDFGTLQKLCSMNDGDTVGEF